MINTTWVWVACVALVSTSLACGGTDAGADDTSSGGSSGTSGGVDSGTDANPTTGSSGGTSSGGADAGKDSGTTPDPTGDDAFTGAPAFVSGKSGTSTSRGQHFLQFGTLNPAKKDCLTCHGSNNDLLMFAGGTVYKDKAATMPAAQVEVRLRNATTGKAVSTYTDALGNFFVRKSDAAAAGVTFPVNAGVRDATSTATMTDLPMVGSCNGGTCHGGNQGWIHLP
jgi:hypothetical protein